jgi:protocatechuate 3,4-dioxygenase beta subunit
MSGPTNAQSPVLTDRDGTFEFLGLPAGSYSIRGEKATYVPATAPSSGQTLRTRFQPLRLADGEIAELTMSIFHGGAIAGRVLDAYGDPVDFANVQVLRVPRGGRPTMAGNGGTNDLGEFRIGRLQPGRYLLRVRPQSFQNFQNNVPTAEPLPQPVPTYYPSVQAVGQAQPITVNRGETIGGLEMVLGEGTPIVVTGTMLNSDGKPISNGNVNARQAGSEIIGGFDMIGGASIRPDGTFRLLLPPGDYTLEAQALTAAGPYQPMRSEDQQFGTLRVTLGANPTEIVTIVLGRGATASGRIVFEGSTPPPSSPGQVRVPMYNPEGPGCRAGQATIAPDWTFKAEALSGICGVSPQPIFGRWTLKAVMFRGQNVMDQTMTFETGQHYGDVQIIVSDRRTQLDLRVTDDAGQPTKDYVALAFPVNKERWNQASRVVRTYVPPQVTGPVMPGAVVSPSAVPVSIDGGVRTSPERFVGLQTGEYYVIALDDMEAEDSFDPAILERLASSAARVLVSEEAPIELPLRRVTFADVIR